MFRLECMLDKNLLSFVIVPTRPGQLTEMATLLEKFWKFVILIKILGNGMKTSEKLADQKFLTLFASCLTF